MKRRERKQTVKNALSTLLTDSNRSTSSSVDPSSADLDDVTCIQEKSSVDSKVYGQVYRRLTVLSCICYASTVFTIFMLFNDKVPDPYMDEPFHVNQAQAYCAGNFTYVRWSCPDFSFRFRLAHSFFSTFEKVEQQNYDTTRPLLCVGASYRTGQPASNVHRTVYIGHSAGRSLLFDLASFRQSALFIRQRLHCLLSQSSNAF